MSTANLMPVVFTQFFDNNGVPLAGGLVYTYQAGTTTPQATYADQAMGVTNANPVVLDSAGRADIWGDPTLSYKFVLKTSGGTTIKTVDNIVGLASNNAIPTAALQDGCVTTAKLAANAVTSAKLASDASTDANRAVQSDHIRNSAVIARTMGASAIETCGITNVGLTATVASNALTITLTDLTGSALSATNIANLMFRSATLTSGALSLVTVAAAISLVVPNGGTLGTTSAVSQYIYVYAINNAGTVELAVAGFPIARDGQIVSTSAVAGATDQYTLYSTTARSSVAIKYIGKIKSTQSTAGTWATSPSEICLRSLSVQSEWTPLTGFTFNNFGTTTNQSLYGRRVGDSLQVRGKFSCGTVPSSQAATLTLPTSLQFSTSKMPTTKGTMLGWFLQYSTNDIAIAAGGEPSVPFYDGSTAGTMYFALHTNNNDLKKNNSDEVSATNIPNGLYFEYPVSGWAE